VSPEPAASKSRAWLWRFLLLSATFLAYLPAWNGQPIWDDAAHVTRPALRSAAGLASIWGQLGATQQYYPLLHSVFWLEHRLWGASTVTVGYHLLNILLHFSSALLLVAILRRLQVRGAWLAGALFALHPVMVESVAWISELKNTLSGTFSLAALLAYLRFDEKREGRFYGTAFLLFILGLLVKSVIVTLPATLLVVFWWRRGRIGWRRDVAPLLPFFVVGLAMGLFTAWVEHRFIGAQGREFDFTFVERCLIAGRAIWFYLYKLLWPADLIFIYPRWHIDSSAPWQYLFPVAFVLATVLFWVLRRRSRAPLAVLLYFAGTLFPALGFFNVYPFLYSFVADHFQYLASIGPIVAAAAVITRGAEHLKNRLHRSAQPVLVGLLTSVLFLLSWRQSRMYSDVETLYRTTLAKNASCWMAHTNLGLLLMDQGRHEDAMSHLQKALLLHPYQADAHNNLGLLLMDMGRTDDARAHLDQALALDPNQAAAHTNLGVLLVRTGRPDEAMAHYLRARELHPDHAEVYYDLGDLLADQGRTDEAMAHYQKALELQPDYADAHNNLGRLLADKGLTDEAIVHFRKALELNPRHANAHNNLGQMLVRARRLDEAIFHYRQALATDPLEVDHLENLVSALLKKGQVAEAVSALQNALALARSTGHDDDARTEEIARKLARLTNAIDSLQPGG